MKPVIESDLLFDDVAIIENALGADYLRATAVNANCNCSSYISSDDESNDPKESTGTAF